MIWRRILEALFFFGAFKLVGFDVDDLLFIHLLCKQLGSLHALTLAPCINDDVHHVRIQMDLAIFLVADVHQQAFGPFSLLPRQSVSIKCV